MDRSSSKSMTDVEEAEQNRAYMGAWERAASWPAILLATLAAEDLARLPDDIGREDLLKIAGIKDKRKRNRVIEMASFGMDIADTMAGLEEKTGAARMKARLADAKLSDAEWMLSHP